MHKDKPDESTLVKSHLVDDLPKYWWCSDRQVWVAYYYFSKLYSRHLYPCLSCGSLPVIWGQDLSKKLLVTKIRQVLPKRLQCWPIMPGRKSVQLHSTLCALWLLLPDRNHRPRLQPNSILMSDTASGSHLLIPLYQPMGARCLFQPTRIHRQNVVSM